MKGMGYGHEMKRYHELLNHGVHHWNLSDTLLEQPFDLVFYSLYD